MSKAYFLLLITMLVACEPSKTDDNKELDCLKETNQHQFTQLEQFEKKLIIDGILSSQDGKGYKDFLVSFLNQKWSFASLSKSMVEYVDIHYVALDESSCLAAKNKEGLLDSLYVVDIEQVVEKIKEIVEKKPDHFFNSRLRQFRFLNVLYRYLAEEKRNNLLTIRIAIKDDKFFVEEQEISLDKLSHVLDLEEERRLSILEPQYKNQILFVLDISENTKMGRVSDIKTILRKRQKKKMALPD